MEALKKDLERTIRCINNFFKESFYSVIFPHESINGAVAKTIKQDEGLYFEFTKMVLTSQNDMNLLFNNDKDYLLLSNNYHKLYFKLNACTNLSLTVGTTGYTNAKGFIKDFYTDKLQEYDKAFYRAVIITDSKNSIGGHFYCNNLQIKETTYGNKLIQLKINNLDLHLYTYENDIDKRNYFIIETQTQSQYAEFSAVIDEIILAIRYITGIFVGKNIYFIGSKSIYFDNNEVLSLTHFFDDLKSGHSATPDLILFHQIDKKVELLEAKYLQDLILELSNSLVYKRAILLICQAHSEPDYVKATLYSVALETITNLIAQKNKDKLKPISDESLAKEIRKELKGTFEKYKTRVLPEAFTKIDSDIDRINSPTNKSKLLSPFYYFKLKLPEKDIESIEKRNDFLHGRILETTDKHYLPIINHRLLFCINCLILKQIGYKGYLLYHVVLYQIANKLELEEYPIRKI